MRIKIIGDNNCARATRHLLRKAGFAVTEFLPADVVTQAPHSGYVIAIDLAPAPHTPSGRTLEVNPDPTPKPDHPTHGQSAPVIGEALPSHGGASSPALPGAGRPREYCGSGILPAGLHASQIENRRRDAGATHSASIHFDSVDSELEGAILRHVTQLAAAPVVVDRPGGVVHSERELRIVVPNSGDAKADEAAAVAVEFGVLRGLLDLASPPSLPKHRGASADKPAWFSRLTGKASWFWRAKADNSAVTLRSSRAKADRSDVALRSSRAKADRSDVALRSSRAKADKSAVTLRSSRAKADKSAVTLRSSLARADKSAAAPRSSPSEGGNKWWRFLPRAAYAMLAVAASLHASPRHVSITSRAAVASRTPQSVHAIEALRADPSAVSERASFLPAAALPPQGQFSTGQAPVKITDGTNTLVVDPCKAQTKFYVSINQTGNAQLVTGTASKKIYICSMHVVVAVGTNVALVEGTGSVCATGTAGVSGFGGATAATGWNFAANGGIALGNGDAAVGAEGANADNLCLFNSGSGQVSGGISYVVQ